MSLQMRTSLFLTALIFTSGLAYAAADVWPQFRGPRGDGLVGAAGVPLKWSETENVKWKTSVPGEGWSSPVVADGQVWMTTATGNGRSLRAVCVNLADGKLLHDIELLAVEVPPAKHKLNSYASPTPILADGKLYAGFGTNGTVCLDTKTQKILWTNTELKCNHQNGPGGSPLLHKGKLITCYDGIDVQFIAALDAATGKVAWKTERSQKVTKAPDQKKAYGTPYLLTVDGREMVLNTAAEYLYATDPETGKELWYIKYPGYSNVPVPVYGDGLVFSATGFDRPEMWAFKPGTKDQSGDITATNVVWRNKIQAPAQPSPLLVGERLYMLSDKGTATCMKAKTGEVLWKEQLGGECSASPIFIDDRVYFFDRDGLCTVVEPGDTFKVLSKNTLETGFMASAAVVGKALVLRTKTHLYRVEQ